MKEEIKAQRWRGDFAKPPGPWVMWAVLSARPPDSKAIVLTTTETVRQAHGLSDYCPPRSPAEAVKSGGTVFHRHSATWSRAWQTGGVSLWQSCPPGCSSWGWECVHVCDKQRKLSALCSLLYFFFFLPLLYFLLWDITYTEKVNVTYAPLNSYKWTYTMEYYSAIKKNTLESVLMRWMKLEPIIQSEVSQKEKHQYSILTHIYGI